MNKFEYFKYISYNSTCLTIIKDLFNNVINLPNTSIYYKTVFKLLKHKDRIETIKDFKKALKIAIKYINFEFVDIMDLPLCYIFDDLNAIKSIIDEKYIFESIIGIKGSLNTLYEIESNPVNKEKVIKNYEKKVLKYKKSDSTITEKPSEDERFNISNPNIIEKFDSIPELDSDSQNANANKRLPAEIIEQKRKKEIYRKRFIKMFDLLKYYQRIMTVLQKIPSDDRSRLVKEIVSGFLNDSNIEYLYEKGIRFITNIGKIKSAINAVLACYEFSLENETSTVDDLLTCLINLNINCKFHELNELIRMKTLLNLFKHVNDNNHMNIIKEGIKNSRNLSLLSYKLSKIGFQQASESHQFTRSLVAYMYQNPGLSLKIVKDLFENKLELEDFDIKYEDLLSEEEISKIYNDNPNDLFYETMQKLFEKMTEKSKKFFELTKLLKCLVRLDPERLNAIKSANYLNDLYVFPDFMEHYKDLMGILGCCE